VFKKPVLLLLACAAAGCNSVPDRKLVYLEPTAATRVATRAIAPQAPNAVREALIANLAADGLEITHANTDEDIISLFYGGNPEPYVDCGWIVTTEPRRGGETERMAAAQAEATLAGARRWPDNIVDRMMRLDGRVVVQLDPLAGGNQTVVATEATYVLTLTSRGSETSNRETISFRTGESASFGVGTSCRATGQLEAAVLDAIPGTAPGLREAGTTPDTDPDIPVAAVTATELVLPDQSGDDLRPLTEEPLDRGQLEQLAQAVAAGIGCAGVELREDPAGPLVLEGFAASADAAEQIVGEVRAQPGGEAVENRLEVAPWPYCEALSMLEPYRLAEGGDMIVLGSVDGALYEQSTLVVDLDPPFTGDQVHLSYFQSDRVVAHIGTLPLSTTEADAPQTLYTDLPVAPPYGRELVIALVTSEPLFPAPRPQFEAAEDFLPTLQGRLAELTAAGNRITATYVFLTVRPRGTG
jgi:hypothetical protein